MNYVKIALYIVSLFFVIYIPLLSFGQQSNSTTNVNNFTINTNRSFDLSGLYISDNQDKYFLKQMDGSLWWIGTDKNDSHVKNIFKGNIDGNNINGQWIDSPLNKTVDSGSLNLTVSSNSFENITINKASSNDKFPVHQLIKFNLTTQALPRFIVTMDSINIKIPRSPIYDVLSVGLSVKKNNNDPIVTTRYLGNREGSSNITLDIKLGPFEFDKKDSGLTVEFMGINKDDASIPSTLINLEESLIQLSDPSFNSYNISNAQQADSIIRSLSPALLLNGCNGLVFTDKIFIPLDELKKKLLSNMPYSQEKSYLGSESPLGCGPNSEYQVKWSIVPIG
jgi:hypothetical protein